MYKILLYYKYVNLTNLEEIAEQQREFCRKFNLKSRIIVAKEGINGTLEGLEDDTKKYIEAMRSIPEFRDISYKISDGTGDAFPKISVKVRNEIVSLHLGDEDFSPVETTGKYITAEELHELIHSGQEFYIIDMRNDYEHKIGYFKDSILPPLKNFRDLPHVIHDLEKFKDKKIVTVCTGGVRCEKASGYLIRKGFKDVSQLKDGIVTYMEKYPNEDFLGKLYVFDKRVSIGFNVESSNHVIVGKCEKCHNPSENYIDCEYIHCKGHRHILLCENCYDENGRAFCSEDCKTKFYSSSILNN